MRCESCLLEAPESLDMPLEAFAEQLSHCDECPLFSGETASGPVQLLVRRFKEQTRVLRKTRNTVRKKDAELDDLKSTLDRYEDRIGILETFQKASSMETEAELSRRLSQLEQQQRSIAAMSTPILQAGEGVLALPIIGVVDENRAQSMMQRLLDEIRRTGARHVILDLTGVEHVDSATIEYLIRLFGAARLLGAKVVITGLRSEIANRMVSLGVDLSQVTAIRDVKRALSLLQRGRLA